VEDGAEREPKGEAGGQASGNASPVLDESRTFGASPRNEPMFKPSLTIRAANLSRRFGLEPGTSEPHSLSRCSARLRDVVQGRRGGTNTASVDPLAGVPEILGGAGYFLAGEPFAIGGLA
jgi:hypothetical protein